jgi:hypothetical protein
VWFAENVLSLISPCLTRGKELVVATQAALPAGQEIKNAVNKAKAVEFKGAIDL